MLKNLKIFFVILIILSVVSPAEAGVIIKSSRISAQVRVRLPRISRKTHARKSTAGYARINFSKPSKYNTLKSELKLISTQNKFEKKLYKHQQKELKKASRLEAKKKRIEAREARIREKELKKAKRRAAKLASSQSSEEATVELNSKTREGGKLVISKDKQAPKKSFWAKLWQALVGK